MPDIFTRASNSGVSKKALLNLKVGLPVNCYSVLPFPMLPWPSGKAMNTWKGAHFLSSIPQSFISSHLLARTIHSASLFF